VNHLETRAAGADDDRCPQRRERRIARPEDPFDFAAGLEVFGEVLAVLAESAEVDDSVDARSRRCLDEVLSAVPVPLLVARTPSIEWTR